MIKTVAVSGATAFALALAAVAVPGPAMAQRSPWCDGQASIVNGQIVTENVTPSGGADGTCEVLVMPNGGVAVQNGGTTKAFDGINAIHEGAGGGHTS